jgi:DNA-directed RNA polymerase specialized sigma24 family protein
VGDEQAFEQLYDLLKPKIVGYVTKLMKTEDAATEVIQEAMIQVSALDPQKSESAFKYGVKSIPRNFLIDPSGKIVAMDLRGKDLAAKLAEIIKTPS